MNRFLAKHETDLQSEAVELFERTFPELKIVRINSGLARSIMGNRIIHLAKKGTPDLWIPSPQLVAEMKVPGKEPTPEQLAWRDWAKKNNVPHIVCDTPEDLVETVQRILDPGAALPITANRLRQLISEQLQFKPSSDEYGYQDELNDWLERVSPRPFAREVVLSDSDRVDFMVDGVAIELKVKCPANAVLRQLARYAQHEAVREILLLSATRAPLLKLPPTLNGKPVRGLHIGRFL